MPTASLALERKSTDEAFCATIQKTFAMLKVPYSPFLCQDD